MRVVINLNSNISSIHTSYFIHFVSNNEENLGISKMPGLSRQCDEWGVQLKLIQLRSKN